MSQTFLEVKNLVKIFGKVTAVDDVSFKVEQGEVVTLLGPSGCGKTTTLRMVAGFEKPNAGEVEIARPRGGCHQSAYQRAAGKTRHRHGVPVLRDLAAHDRF